jgi:glycosyltransferase involved in cell wall biosynthesis
MLKVLISAYACEPHKGSEPGVGWNWSKQIARFAEVWVITRANNRDVIERELTENPVPNLHFVYYDVPRWLSFWKRKKRGVHLYYFLWQANAFRLAKKTHRQITFDIVHHITFGNILLPTFMANLGIPFIWGPLGGGEQIPKAFTRGYPFKAKIREIIRNMINGTLKINGLFFFNCRKANRIIVKTSDTAVKIPARYKNKVIVTTDVATEPVNREKRVSDNSVIQIIAVGQLEPWRGFDLLIKALSKVVGEQNEIRLIIVGDGSDRERLLSICSAEHLRDRVVFTGQLSMQKYFDCMLESSVFVNPGLKEGGVTVLFDALSMGIPVICMDVPGASHVVDTQCGIKIKPVNPEQIISELSTAILKLSNDPELRRKMGEAGKKRVREHYTWEKKGEFIRKVYEEVLNEKLSGGS